MRAEELGRDTDYMFYRKFMRRVQQSGTVTIPKWFSSTEFYVVPGESTVRAYTVTQEHLRFAYLVYPNHIELGDRWMTCRDCDFAKWMLIYNFFLPGDLTISDRPEIGTGAYRVMRSAEFSQWFSAEVLAWAPFISVDDSQRMYRIKFLKATAGSAVKASTLAKFMMERPSES